MDEKGVLLGFGERMEYDTMLVLDHNAAYVDGKGKEYYLNLLVNESTP